MEEIAVQNKPILFVSPLPPPQGGIAVWTEKIFANGLPDGSPLTLVNTRIRGKRHIFDKAFLSFAELKRTITIVLSFLSQCLRHRPKLIHINCSLSAIGILRDYTCLRLAKLFHLPVVMHYHGNVSDFPTQRLGGYSQKILIALMQKAQANIFINACSFDKARDYAPSNPFLLPNFVDENVFLPLPIRHRNARLKVIFGGGITKAKGCEEILQAARALPTITFHLYGKLHADLSSAFSNVPDNMVLHGEVKHAQLMTALREADILIFPSYTEGFPLTVLEAMSVGLPVIATTVGALPEMIETNQGGFLIPPRNAAALIKALKQFQTNPTLCSIMGAFNQQKSFTHYRYSVVIKQLSFIYKTVLET